MFVRKNRVKSLRRGASVSELLSVCVCHNSREKSRCAEKELKLRPGNNTLLFNSANGNDKHSEKVRILCRK